MSKQRRVVITGRGAVTPFGIGVPVFLEALQKGQSGIRLLEQLDTAQLPTKGGGEVRTAMPPVGGLPGMVPRVVQFAAHAFQEAWRESGLSEEKLDRSRIGVLLGTSRGVVRELELAAALLRQIGVQRLQAEHPELLQLLFPVWGSGVLSHSIARLAGAAGHVGTVSAACASGTIAIGEAARLIREGVCEVVIAGGAEAPFAPTSFAGVCSSKAMSERWDDPAAACRPFDAARDGYVMGEGAGVLILESLDHARARGARPCAEIVGYAQTDDASHITVPTGEGLRTAIGLALQEACCDPHELDYINAHGTSTRLNDKWETWALRQALGKAAHRVPASSTKSMTGHLLGAAGAVEAVACLLAMEHSFLPPTINYGQQDPDCDLDYVPNRARSRHVHLALSQSLGFGGHNAVLLFLGK
ncbi:3-oxoacyl-[acyl-carrier-protein] synthase II [Tumebacillus sp. BK434]|uniref:beta-ketoacyl-[acyl-carrier-protein] synthase family protein n=1 Tax=Tumebacillus sp. BK434 TaxID=2512169 RepID=UPI001047CAEE|nr:beta-ketoacyl-[acyl-carrier-protein] synthase family protein [Tumebacillus sp. BK434]TCP57831.1 3-oxoacyl-[acyl-carrier-protein] synthase II [Tumebacillus sp. BK434]